MSSVNTTNQDVYNVDESLYSRQMYVYGTGMRNIKEAIVLVYGIGALATETIKNLALAGVKQIDIIDAGAIVDETEYGTNFFITEDVLGQNLANVLVAELKKLNSDVTFRIVKPDYINMTDYSVVVVFDTDYINQLPINKIAHDSNIPYISATTMGLTGTIFTDFGESFVVNDINGENIKEASISNAYIQTDKDGTTKWVVESLDKHDLSIGEWLTLHNTLNKVTKGPYQIKDTKRSGDNLTHIIYLEPIENGETSFEPSLFSTYGELKEVKQSTTFKFKTLDVALKEPSFCPILYEQMSSQDTLHAIYQMLSLYLQTFGTMPKAYNKTDFDNFMSFNNSEEFGKELDKDLIKMFINHNGIVAPVISVIGSITSQEILKAIMSKYTPIHQFLYFESFDSLPKFENEHDMVLDESVDPRYGQLINVFGKEFVQKLHNINLFMVGCGAIGCELLKNFAMMGICCGNGSLTVTDPDTIENSNLNRQFLFKKRHIGEFKSEAAVEAVKRMNPNMNIIPQQNKIGPDTEEFYDHKFYSKLFMVVNALDNINARRYVDNKCVENNLPLIDSGTLGVKGNVQVVVPHKSESYCSSNDPPETDIPVCTLKNFPHQIAHTAQYALSVFKGIFEDTANNINRYLENPRFVLELEPDEVENVYTSIMRYAVEDVPKTTYDSIIVAIKHFNYYFHDVIQELLKQFPSDSTTSDGLPFWSGTKRCPVPVEFDVTDQLHMLFVTNFTFLYNNMYNLSDTTEVTSELVANILSSVSPFPSYTVKEKFAANDEEEKKNKEAKKGANETSDMVRALNPDILKLNVTHMFADKFEKDNDSNHHVDFITATTNLRATNYHIPLGDRHKIKGIVGRIIPAIATTTSLVSGLVTLELCKYVMGEVDIARFRNAFINLGISLFAFSEPAPVKVQKLGDKEFTMWNQLDIRGDMTMGQFRKQISDFYGTEVDSVMCGRKSLFSSFSASYSPEERDNMMMSELFKSMEISTQNGNYVSISIMLDTDNIENAENFEEPDVRYWL
jgi:ubiquitin-activating enzyme E1